MNKYIVRVFACVFVNLPEYITHAYKITYMYAILIKVYQNPVSSM